MTIKQIIISVIVMPLYSPIAISYIISNNKKYINSDLERISKDSYNQFPVSLLLLIYVFMKSREYRNIFYYRIGQRKMHATLLKGIYKEKPDLEIRCKNIGFGMRIHHGHSTVIYAQSIGDNFTVWQNVTIGRGNIIDGIDIPLIGDNVKIFTGSILFGGIKIGDNVTIGAGCLINNNVSSDMKIKMGSTQIGKSD